MSAHRYSPRPDWLWIVAGTLMVSGFYPLILLCCAVVAAVQS